MGGVGFAGGGDNGRSLGSAVKSTTGALLGAVAYTGRCRISFSLSRDYANVIVTRLYHEAAVDFLSPRSRWRLLGPSTFLLTRRILLFPREKWMISNYPSTCSFVGC